MGVALLALLGASCGSGKPPLVQRAGSAVSTSARVHLDGSVSIGVIDIARYDGHEPAVFDQVVPNEPVEGVRLLGYLVVTDPGDGIRSADGFPPKGFHAEPVRGFSLHPGVGPVQIVVGPDADARGRPPHRGVHPPLPCGVGPVRTAVRRGRVGLQLRVQRLLTLEGDGMERRGAWWGYAFVVVLLIGQLMVTLPASDDPTFAIRHYYAGPHRSIVLVAQALGVLASLLFIGFAVSLSRRVAESRSRLILASGLLVALASFVTAAPPLALALSPHRPLSGVHTLARAGDITDAVLFGFVAVFAAAMWTEGLPGWLRGLSAVVALLALGRAIISPLGSAALDAIAPIGFIALVLAISHWVLARPRQGVVEPA